MSNLDIVQRTKCQIYTNADKEKNDHAKIGKLKKNFYLKIFKERGKAKLKTKHLNIFMKKLYFGLKIIFLLF